MTPADRALVEQLIANAIAPCPHCARARLENRRAEERRRLDEIASMPAKERAAAVAALTAHERQKFFAGRDWRIVLAIVRDLDDEHRRAALADVPHGVRSMVEAWLRPLVAHVRVTARGMVGRTPETMVERDLAQRLAAHGFVIEQDNRRQLFYRGTVLEAQTWPADALDAVLQADPAFAAMVADGRVSVEPLDEETSRKLMIAASERVPYSTELPR